LSVWVENLWNLQNLPLKVFEKSLILIVKYKVQEPSMRFKGTTISPANWDLPLREMTPSIEDSWGLITCYMIALKYDMIAFNKHDTIVQMRHTFVYLKVGQNITI
jgi:hypothetical protein